MTEHNELSLHPHDHANRNPMKDAPARLREVLHVLGRDFGIAEIEWVKEMDDVDVLVAALQEALAALVVAAALGGSDDG